jgi:hypothetical protein
MGSLSVLFNSLLPSVVHKLNKATKYYLFIYIYVYSFINTEIFNHYLFSFKYHNSCSEIFTNLLRVELFKNF